MSKPKKKKSATQHSKNRKQQRRSEANQKLSKFKDEMEQNEVSLSSVREQ